MSSEPIAIFPIGSVPERDLTDLGVELESIFKREVEIIDPVEIPNVRREGESKRKVKRKLEGVGEVQYNVVPLMDIARQFSRKYGKKYLRVLAVTDVDLYTPGLNFIFGQAEIAGSTAIIAIPRLKYQQFWSHGRRKEEQKDLYLTRLVKEAVHELGHTFGLRHCDDKGCVMTFSNCLEDTDFKSTEFCTKCRAEISE